MSALLKKFLNIFKADTIRYDKLASEDYKDNTRAHWSVNPCGSNYSDSIPLTLDYFNEIELHRYKSHPWIKQSIESFDLKGKATLEIGYGMGTDHLNLARQGAKLHGIDLTPENHKVTSNRFKLNNQTSELTIGDAEKLPYPNDFFDFVYSFGVIHHSPSTEAVIKEIHRVLKKDGRCWITVYHKNSIFFWWTTFLIHYIYKGGRKKRTLQQQISLIEYPNNSENMVIRLYKKQELRKLFENFTKADCHITHLLPDDIYYFSRFFKNGNQPNKFLSSVGNKFGWYLVVDAQK